LTKAELVKVLRQVERLIAPMKIDLIHLTRDEGLRLENARRLLAKVTGSPYP
jgi:hypothetical protein